MRKNYQALTEEYLSLFQDEWKALLENMKCGQSQLLLGSRLRPQIVLWGYLVGIEWHGKLNLKIPICAAASVELIHKASLLLDDWIDDDDERHGTEAFHVKYGEHTAVMTATKMVAESINHILRSDNCIEVKLKLINLLTQTATTMANGALSELTLDDNQIFDFDIIKNIAQMETSEILGNSLLIGYTLSGCTNDTVSAYLKKIGNLSGYLFQTLNDLESFSNVALNRLHKGNENFDFNRRRKNIVIAYMNSFLSQNEHSKIMNASPEYVLSLYKKHHIKQLILREMELVFGEIEKLVHSIGKQNVAIEWVDGYLWFLNLLKETASKRVSWDK